MILFTLAYLGGLLTVLSPCILPVLPFVFSRAEQPFRSSSLPLLAGMSLTFAGVSTLAVVGGSWVIHANEWGRWVALVLLSLFAGSLLFPEIAEWVTRPFTRLGGSLSPVGSEKQGIGRSFLLGVATGFLWAPCAGPILGLILTSAAISGANAKTSLLLLAYALGAATSLAIALSAGSRLLKGLRNYLGFDQGVRRVIGIAVLAGVLTIVLGWDRGTLTRLSRFHTEALEQKLVGWFRPETTASTKLETAAGKDQLPELSGATGWINSPPLTRESLRGKVVLIDFWTYSCINCLRSLPYIEAWYQKYKDSGLVIIGVHTPEFAFEKNAANVEKAVHDLGLTYPIAMDSQYAIWNAFGNEYWPAHYFIDATGRIRGHSFGEGDYAASEHTLQDLLAEAHAADVPRGVVQVQGEGAEAASRSDAVESEETYIGYSRSQNGIFQPTLQRDQEATYTTPPPLELNQWSLSGRWKIGPENATLMKAPGKILFRFHARDVHVVLGPGPTGKPIRFVVHLDDQPPQADHGVDIDASGKGEIRGERLYQLIRQTGGAIRERIFEIEFLDPGAQAFAFTFG